MDKIYKYGVIAIHGGNIEPGTSEIASALSYIGGFPLYLNEKSPHIHSSEFDNNEIRSFLKNVEIVISIHGEKNKKDAFVIVGGAGHLSCRYNRKFSLREWFY